MCVSGKGGEGGGLSTFDIEVSSRTRSYWITWYIYSLIYRLRSNTSTGRGEEWGFPWSCCDKLVTKSAQVLEPSSRMDAAVPVRSYCCKVLLS